MTLIFLIVVTVVCLSVTSSIYKKYWDYGLDATVFFEKDKIEEGQCVVLKERIENRKWLPLPTLMLKFGMDRSLQCTDSIHTSVTDKQYRNDSIPIMANERVTRSVEIMGTQRGFYGIEEIRLVATDILFRSILNKTSENQTFVYVYPSRSKFVRLPEIFQYMYGECISKQFLQEDSMEFRGIREYTQADPMRRINWKASAKSGNLKVNQYYDSSSQRLTIFLNVSQSGILKYYDLIEESIRIARNFIEAFIGKGIPVQIISNGVDKITGQEIRIREGAGLAHIDACLKQLAKMDIYAPSRGMDEMIREQSLLEEGEVSLLISAEQTVELATAYLEYAGVEGSANWLIPIHRMTQSYLEENVSDVKMRGRSGAHIRTEYLVMEELEEYGI